MSETTSQFVYREVGSDGIDAVRALWEKLNVHHARKSPRFGDKLRLRTFDARKQELLAKADAKNLCARLGIVQRGGTAGRVGDGARASTSPGGIGSSAPIEPNPKLVTTA